MSAALATVDRPIVRVHMTQHAQPVADHLGCRGNSGPSGWAVCRTYPQAERWARDNLRHQGYNAFLPLCLVLRRDRVLRTLTHQVEAPLFVGYLFVRCERRDVWRPIRETPGVHSIIHDGNGIQYAPDAAVSALQATEASRRTPTTPGALWAAGDPCKPAHGPFAGHDAVVLSVNRLTATVGLLLFGQMREVSVPVTSLAPRNAE